MYVGAEIGGKSMNDLLKALADADREREAPARVEAQLIQAFRRKHSRPKWPYFAMAAAAAIVLLFILRPKPQVIVQAPQIAIVTPVAAVAEKPPVARKVMHRKARPREVVTDFYPLIEDAPPFEGGELLRVSLPASAMRDVGFLVSEERLTETVQADVLVGQEGLARAIRFVRYER
jgi:hypothetical protein